MLVNGFIILNGAFDKYDEGSISFSKSYYFNVESRVKTFSM